MQPNSNRNIWIAGITLHILAAWFSVGYYHVDEHFQLLEFASYKLNRNELSNLPWEYGAGIRPSLQVLVAYLVTSSLQFLTPFQTAFMLRLFSVVLAMLAIRQAGKVTYTNSPQYLKLYYLFSFFLWFMPYQHVRFSSENWSGIMILFAIAMTLKGKSFLHAGLFSGLAFCFRYQSAFFITGLFLWMLLIKRANFRQIATYVIAFLAVFAISVISDYWLYGKWLLAPYRYFQVNIIEGVATQYGTRPFYYYFTSIMSSSILPIGILLLAAFTYYLVRKPKSIYLWTALPFLLMHCLLGHKELRFLFPLVYFIPAFLVFMIKRINASRLAKAPAYKICWWILMIVNLAALPVSSFKASSPRISLLESLYFQQEKPVCFVENPYKTVQWLSYYFPQKFDPRALKLVQVPDSINKGSLLLIPSYNARQVQGAQIVYRQVPEWLEDYNYGNWLDRSNFWCMARMR